ncbi:MAG: hypothetical protein ABIQ35_06060 [Verrucomicrobiota bacterium]
MNFSRTKFYKPALLALAACLFFAVFQVERLMNHDREALGLTRVTPLKNAPPVLAFTTVALGGFRGLISNALWIRANDLQEEDKMFEAVQLADWITKLEPHFGQVWFFQAWNMAYNISVKFSDPADRWRWVRRGMVLLRDDGLEWNPDETLLYRELSWIFQHKMGNNLDDAHTYYKTAWAGEMQEVLKGRPDYPELLNPQTDEAKARVKRLRSEYKMDPQLMKEVDELYGPLEWRLPDAHAIYWAEKGRRIAKKEDQETLRRSIYQTMQMAFMRGGFSENKIDKTFTLGPNLDLMEKANHTYEMMMEDDPSKRDLVKTGHKNFLLTGVYFLYTGNREKEAAKWFAYLQEKYPQAVLDANKRKMSLDEFAIAQMMGDVTETDSIKTTQAIMGLLTSKYYQLALDDESASLNYANMAQKVWSRYTAEVKGTGDRIALKPMVELNRVVREKLFDPENSMFSPQMIAQLRSRLGESAPTNAPATNAAPVEPTPPAAPVKK